MSVVHKSQCAEAVMKDSCSYIELCDHILVSNTPESTQLLLPVHMKNIFRQHWDSIYCKNYITLYFHHI